jgi:ferrochelatase
LEAQKTGILLVNLGTPDSPATPDVRRYLVEFLTDPRVIDIPAIRRQLLVRGIIAPFRAPKSGASYKAIWTDKGSPLLYISRALRDLVAA